MFTTVFLGLTPFQVSAAIAQESAVDVSADAGASTHAKSLAAPQWIGRSVLDPDGNRLGEIESVLVNGSGEALSVILDIGGWLEPNEHIRVPLVDLRMNESGQISSILTKTAADRTERYRYTDPFLRGGILLENGAAYIPGAQGANEAK